MPYILRERREKLDPYIDALCTQLNVLGSEEGDLNYSITKLVLAKWKDEARYTTISRITGVLENVKQEFYRRHAGPYEDEAILRNGDIDRAM